MRKLIVIVALSAIVLLALRRGPAAPAAAHATPTEDEVEQPRAPLPEWPMRASFSNRARRAEPGTYTPRGFAPDYRDRVKRDFSTLVEARLGHPLTPEQASLAAAVQDAFWDLHGPNVDLFREHQISQPELAERTHAAMIEFASGMERVFNSEDFEKVFDVPKGSDPYPLIFHSKEEQPGLAMRSGLDRPTPTSTIGPLSTMSTPARPVMPEPAHEAIETTHSAPSEPATAKIPPASTR
jgi:hypothetical protein